MCNVYEIKNLASIYINCSTTNKYSQEIGLELISLHLHKFQNLVNNKNLVQKFMYKQMDKLQYWIFSEQLNELQIHHKLKFTIKEN